ncbi:MAG: glycosyltransferase family 39 protein [Anaerolineae bacterium]
MGTKAKRWQYALLGIIVLMSVALRFYHLGTQSLWNDEGTTVALVQRDIPTILRNAAADIHPPLYYLVLQAWVKLTGISEFAVRALSALTGVGLVLVVYLLGRILLRRDIALLAALYTGLSSFQVYYSQETRMYMWAALLGALSWLVFLHLVKPVSQAPLRRWSCGWACTYLVISSAATYSHYLLFAVVLSQNAAFLYVWLSQGKQRQMVWLSRWIVLQLALVIAYVPWLIVSWNSLTGWPAVGGVLSFGQFISRAGQVLAYGVTIPQRTLLLGSGLVLLILAVIVPLVARRRGAWLLWFYLIVPLVTLFTLSIGRPLYKDKFLLFVSPAYTLMLAVATIGFAERLNLIMRQRWLGWIVSALVLASIITTSLVSLLHLYYDPTFFRDDYRGITAYIQHTAGPDDAILINAPSQIETVAYYHHGPQPMVPLPSSRPLDKVQVQAELESLASRYERIYGIFWATNESDPERFIETWLDQHTFKAIDQWYGNLRLVIYATPHTNSNALQQPTDIIFGNTIHLTGYSLSTLRVRPGDVVQLSLFWQADETINKRFKVFVHLVNEQGQIVAQRDAEPGGGAALTTTWKPGAVITDSYGVLLPIDTLPGILTVRIGLYDLESGQRLEAREGRRSLGDALDLAQIEVNKSN